MSGDPTRPAVKPVSFYCPNCGGSIVLRGYAHTLTASCQYCGALLDTSTPAVKLLREAQARTQKRPLIELGSRGKLQRGEWQVIGYQERTTGEGEDEYTWNEYVLFHPYNGFRYLTEFEDRWNFVRPCYKLPRREGNAVVLDGRRFRADESGVARTTYVLGEFPWRVQLGETVSFIDHVDANGILSAEFTENGGEVTWSLGQRLSSLEVREAFLQTAAPATANKVVSGGSPYAGKVGGLWRMWLFALVGLALLGIVSMVLLHGEELFRRSYVFDPHVSGEASFVTPVFRVPAPGRNLRVRIDTDLENNRAHFNFALISTSGGKAYNFDEEVAFYEGTDSDGRWTEGRKNNNVTIGPVDPGEYYLRVEPEADKAAATPPLRYTVSVRHGVLSSEFFVLAVILLTIPPVVRTFRALHHRKQEMTRS